MPHREKQQGRQKVEGRGGVLLTATPSRFDHPLTSLFLFLSSCICYNLLLRFQPVVGFGGSSGVGCIGLHTDPFSSR